MSAAESGERRLGDFADGGAGAGENGVGDPSRAEHDRIMEEAQGMPPLLRFVSMGEFAAVDEPGAEALASDGEGGAVLPAAGFLLVYGDGGVGKTTLVVDLVTHLAAGESWQSLVHPVRPLRVALIENEGPRAEFRRKLRRKLDAGWRERIAAAAGGAREPDVLEEPWAALDLRDDGHRGELARAIREREVDLVVAGPLSDLGMEGGGTRDEIRDFKALLDRVRAGSGTTVTFLLIHHENRGGKVSGAWEGVPDTLVHVQKAGHGHARVFWQKVRWSSPLHQTTTKLAWSDGEGFVVEVEETTSEEEIQEAIATFVLANGGCSWNKVEKSKDVPGHVPKRRDVRDQMIRGGELVDLGKARQDGVWLYKLWHRDDPARPSGEGVRPLSDELLDEPSSAAPAGEGEGGSSVRPPPKEGRTTDEPPPATGDPAEPDLWRDEPG